MLERTTASVTSGRLASTPSPDEAGVRKAADALLAAIDAYDTKAFAALCVEKAKDGRLVPSDPKALAATLSDLHQKYGALARTVRVLSVPPDSADAIVGVAFGDESDAIELTLTRVDGAWKLSTISSASLDEITPPPPK